MKKIYYKRKFSKKMENIINKFGLERDELFKIR